MEFGEGAELTLIQLKSLLTILIQRFLTTIFKTFSLLFLVNRRWNFNSALLIILIKRVIFKLFKRFIRLFFLDPLQMPSRLNLIPTAFTATAIIHASVQLELLFQL